MIDPPALPTLPPAEPAGDDEGPLDALPRLAVLDDGADDADASGEVGIPVRLAEAHDAGDDADAGDLVVAVTALPVAHADDAGESEGAGVGMEGGWAPAPLPSADGGEASDAEPLEALVAGPLPELDADAEGDAELTLGLLPTTGDEAAPRAEPTPWPDAAQVAGAFTGLVSTPRGLLATGAALVRLAPAPAVLHDAPVARALWCPALGGLVLQGRSGLSVLALAEAEPGAPRPLGGAAASALGLLAVTQDGGAILVERGAALARLGVDGALSPLAHPGGVAGAGRGQPGGRAGPAFGRPVAASGAALLVEGPAGWALAELDPGGAWRLQPLAWTAPRRSLEAPLLVVGRAGVALAHPGTGVTWLAPGAAPRPLGGTRGVTALALHEHAGGVELAVALVDDARGEVVVLVGAVPSTPVADPSGGAVPLAPIAVLRTPEGDPEPLRLEALAYADDGALLWAVGPAGARAWRRP